MPELVSRDFQVSVILVCWNNREDTLDCLESLRECGYPALDVLVVDNGSTDGTGRAVGERFPCVRVLDAGGNRGFAGGNNLGMKDAFGRGADCALLLNNDTTLEPDCVRRLTGAVRSDPGIGVAVPAIYHHAQPQTPWFVGSTLDMESGLALHDNRTIPDRPVEIPWATGCAMLVAREAWEQTSGFDERFFLYGEDVEWSIRLRAAGFRLTLIPSAHLYHRVSRSLGALSPRVVYYSARNNLLWVDEHAPADIRTEALRRVAWRHLREALRLAKNDPCSAAGLPLYVLRGIVDFRRGRFGPL